MELIQFSQLISHSSFLRGRQADPFTLWDNISSLKIIFCLFSEPSPDFQLAFRNACNRSCNGMKYHSCQFYVQTYTYFSPPTLSSPMYTSKTSLLPHCQNFRSWQSFSIICSSGFLSPFHDCCFPKIKIKILVYTYGFKGRAFWVDCLWSLWDRVALSLAWFTLKFVS